MAIIRSWRPHHRWIWLGSSRALLAQTNPIAHNAAAALPSSVAAADLEAFEAFVHQYERSILNYLWRMTGDEQSARDLTQETFLRAWKQFAHIRHYDNPRAWLFRVATNLALTLQSRRMSPVGAATPLEETFGPATSDPARRVVESELVRRALQELSPKRRAALVLREVYGWAAVDIGQFLHISAEAVKMTLHRAREQFRTIYLT